MRDLVKGIFARSQFRGTDHLGAWNRLLIHTLRLASLIKLRPNECNNYQHRWACSASWEG